jgi:hypothetical protein
MHRPCHQALRPPTGGCYCVVIVFLAAASCPAQAAVDCYDEDEELAGFAVMMEDNLAIPFETTVPGVTMTM